VLQAVVIASAGLLLAASIPLAPDALTDPVTFAIAIVSLIILLTTELDALWIILASAAVSLSASSLGLMASFGKARRNEHFEIETRHILFATPASHRGPHVGLPRKRRHGARAAKLTIAITTA